MIFGMPNLLKNLSAGTLLLLLCACGASYHPAAPTAPQSPADPISELLDETPPLQQAENRPLQKMGYSTQVGAFSSLENAVRLEQALEASGIDAYYFRHESGLYKVRFGNHPSYEAARGEAEQLRQQGLIGNFFIVIPDDYAAAQIQRTGRGDMRDELVNTASRFLGVPYRWGGVDSDNGFDCSGLTMVSYRLNGLDLPRNSRAQFDAGRYVSKTSLQKGDLVFFATKGGRRVTHVGMYVGNGNFIHAPRTGKTVRIASLSDKFFRQTYVGARTYL